MSRFREGNRKIILIWYHFVIENNDIDVYRKRLFYSLYNVNIKERICCKRKGLQLLNGDQLNKEKDING